MKTVHFGVLGCGLRMHFLLNELMKKKGIELVGGWDPSSVNTQDLLDKQNGGKGIIFNSYKEMLSDENIDWVLIGSPNVFHKEHIVASFLYGKNVFAEKPMATSIPDCIDINKAHLGSEKLFATGFTLRYAELYRKIKEIISSGKLGKIVSISASENITPEHGTHIMTGWRRKKEISGSHILEKCVHDLDLINWFTDSLPVRVAAFGGNNMFIPEHSSLYDSSRNVFEAWEHNMVPETFDKGERNPFLAEKTIEDNIVAIMEFKNGIKAQFQATMSNTIPERRMYLNCTEGTLIAELYTGSLKYKSLRDEATQVLSMQGGGHGGGDTPIMSELHDSMIYGTEPVCSGNEGLQSVVVALSIDRAREEGKIIDLGGFWETLGF